MPRGATPPDCPRERKLCNGVVVLSIWLLVVVTFTSPGRHATQSTADIDLLALAKLGARAAAFAMLGVVLLVRGPRRLKDTLGYSFLPLAMFTGWSVASAAWSARPAVSIAQAGCLSLLVMLAIVIAATIRNTADLARIIKHLTLALLAVSAILVAARVSSLGLGTLSRNDAGAGSTGILHPTTAASTASLGIILLLGARLAWNRRWSGWVCWPGVICHGLVLYWSAARLALALTVLAAGALVIAYASRHLLRGAALAFSVVGLALLIANPGLHALDEVTYSVQRYVERGQSTEQLTSLSGRAELWPLMWESFRQSPLRGHGYYVTTAAGEVRVWGDRGNISAHNVFLQAMTTLGLVGLLLLAWGIYQPLAVFARSSFESDETRPLALVLPVLWLWFLGWSLLNISFLAPFQPESAVFFATLGLAAGWSGLSRDPSADELRAPLPADKGDMAGVPA